MVFVYFDFILFERFYQEYYQSKKYFLQNKKKSVDSISKKILYCFEILSRNLAIHNALIKLNCYM